MTVCAQLTYRDQRVMVGISPSGNGESAIRDLWERTLAQVPSVFGQLMYLASLRDGHNGRYRHYGLAQRYGEEATHHALNASHERVFAEWVGYSLDKQRSELEIYLDGIEESRADVFKSWAAIAPYKNLVPAGAGDAERYLYVSDLELILELLRNELS